MEFTVEDWHQWFIQDETKEFFKLLLEEKESSLNAILNVTATGDDLSKDFYSLQGEAIGLQEAYNLARELAQYT